MTRNASASGTAEESRRVLLVEITHGGTFGGSHQALYDLARHLDPVRYTPVVLVYEQSPFVDRLRALGIQVIVWDAQWRTEHGARARWFSPRRALRLTSAVLRRVSLLKRERIDLVHINNSPSYSYYDWLPAARIAAIPCVTHLRGELYPIRHRVIHWLNCRFDRFITISSYVTSILERERFPRDRIEQIEDGIDPDWVRSSVTRSRESVREALGIPESAQLAVMAGHLRHWKGQDVVLSALAELEPRLRTRIIVAFAGADDPYDTAYRRRLDELVKQHGLEQSVRFLGARSDVPDLMHAADIVLHASTTPEPFGLVVLEGMAHGRLVIAAALGGPLQILGDGGGWLFDPRDPGELATLLRQALCHPELASESAAVAPARALRFTAQRTADRVQSVYDQVLV